MASPDRSDSAWVIVLALVLLLLIPGALMLGFWGLGVGWMMGPGTSWTWGGWLAMAVGLALLVLIILLLVRAVQSVPPRPAYSYPAYPVPPYAPAPPPAPLTPVQILEQRYARGEITRDEYLRMRADLETPGR